MNAPRECPCAVEYCGDDHLCPECAANEQSYAEDRREAANDDARFQRERGSE